MLPMHSEWTAYPNGNEPVSVLKVEHTIDHGIKVIDARDFTALRFAFLQLCRTFTSADNCFEVMQSVVEKLRHNHRIDGTCIEMFKSFLDVSREYSSNSSV